MMALHHAMQSSERDVHSKLALLSDKVAMFESRLSQMLERQSRLRNTLAARSRQMLHSLHDAAGVEEKGRGSLEEPSSEWREKA